MTDDNVPGSSPLEKLPNELMTEVVKSLDGKAIARLLRVSRQMQNQVGGVPGANAFVKRLALISDFVRDLHERAAPEGRLPEERAEEPEEEENDDMIFDLWETTHQRVAAIARNLPASPPDIPDKLVKQILEMQDEEAQAGAILGIASKTDFLKKEQISDIMDATIGIYESENSHSDARAIARIILDYWATDEKTKNLMSSEQNERYVSVRDKHPEVDYLVVSSAYMGGETRCEVVEEYARGINTTYSLHKDLIRPVFGPIEKHQDALIADLHNRLNGVQVAEVPEDDDSFRVLTDPIRLEMSAGEIEAAVKVADDEFRNPSRSRARGGGRDI